MPEDEELDNQDEQQDEEEQEDPLAGMPDEDRARIEALIAEREQAAQAAAEAEFNERISKRDARVNTRLQNLQKIGVGFGDDDTVAFTDPAKLGQVALGFVGQGAPKPEKPEPEAVVIDWNGDVDAQIANLVDQRASSRLEALLDEKLAPLMKQMEQARALAGRPLLAQVADLAREQLDDSNVGHLADHEYFDEALRQAVKDSLPEDKWSDPVAVGSLASMVGFDLSRRFPDQKTKRTERNQDADNANVYRNSLGATGASRGGGRDDGRTAEGQARKEYSQFKEAFPELSHLSFEQFQMTGKGGNYGEFVAAGRKNGRTR